MNETTVQLVKQAKGRDPDAFADLIHFYEKDMYQTAIAILMNDDDAADAISDTILSCWEKIDTLKQEVYFKTWMTRILINKCYDYLRRRKRIVPLEEAAEQAVEDRNDIEWREAMGSLREKYRIVMILFYCQGYKTQEIAKLLHIPKSTVQTRLQRGREQLASYYGIHGKDEKDDKKRGIGCGKASEAEC